MHVGGDLLHGTLPAQLRSGDGFGTAGPQQGRDRDQQRRQQGSRAKEGLHQGR